MTATMVRYLICVFIIVFFCNPWPRKCMFRHQDLFSTLIRNCDIKTCIFRRPFLKMAAIRFKGQIYVFVIVIFVILGPENVYLDTKIIFPSDLETEILRHVYSVGHFEKWPSLRSRVKFGMALQLKFTAMVCSNSMQNFMLLSLDEHFFYQSA